MRLYNRSTAVPRTLVQLICLNAQALRCIPLHAPAGQSSHDPSKRCHICKRAAPCMVQRRRWCAKGAEGYAGHASIPADDGSSRAVYHCTVKHAK